MRVNFSTESILQHTYLVYMDTVSIMTAAVWLLLLLCWCVLCNCYNCCCMLCTKALGVAVEMAALHRAVIG